MKQYIINELDLWRLLNDSIQIALLKGYGDKSWFKNSYTYSNTAFDVIRKNCKNKDYIEIRDSLKILTKNFSEVGDKYELS